MANTKTKTRSKSLTCNRLNDLHTESRLVYTAAYRPFVMGGDCNHFIATTLKCEGPYDLGRGYVGWTTIAPNGATFVVEDTTGAIVGSTLGQVRKDIEEGDPKLMKKQIAEAEINVAKASVRDEYYFWQQMRCSK